MKKLFTVILGIALILPLHSQEIKTEAVEQDVQNEAATGEDVEEDLEIETPKKGKIDFNRKYFEIGFDIGAGFDNGLVGTDDIFQKSIVIDMSKLSESISKNGADINFSISPGFFINIKNIHIMDKQYEFGLLFDVDGGVKANISKSLFTLISEGNINKHNSKGSITASGGIFTEIGLRGSTKIEIAGKPLRIGVKPSIFTPVVYIPSDSGIYYSLTTTQGDEEGIFVSTKGEINIYSPTSFENIDPGRFILGDCGFDLSLEGEYPLFAFLDVGGSISNIPFVPAKLSNQMKLKMTEFNIDIPSENLMSGAIPEIPEIDFDQTYNNSASLKVARLLRFDVYARFKPFNSELLVLKPNLGFSANVNQGDGEGFFNVGLDVIFNPFNNLLTLSLGTNYKETVWMQKAGLNLNLRAFELDLDAALRNQDFIGSFNGKGFDLNLGLRFGW